MQSFYIKHKVVKSNIISNMKTLLLILTAMVFVMSCCACAELDGSNIVVSNNPTLDNNLTQSTDPTQGNNPTQNAEPTQNNNPTQNGNGTTDDDNGDYAIGGSGTSSEVLSAFVARCKIQKTFSAEDAYIPVEFSFGVVEGCGVGAERYEEAVVFIGSGDEQVFIIRRHSSEELETPEYTAKIVWDEEHKHAIDYEYSHTESINLPLSMFTGDSGRIWIGLHVCTFHGSEQHKRGESGGVWLFYSRDRSTNTIHIERIE